MVAAPSSRPSNFDTYASILRMYRNVEFLNPFILDRIYETYPDDLIEVKANSPMPCPWEDLELYGLNAEYQYNYDFFLAPFELQEVKRVISEYNSQLYYGDYSDARREDGLSCFARIRIGDKGNIIFSDVSISTVPFAIMRIISDQMLSLSAFDDFSQSIFSLMQQNEKTNANDSNKETLNWRALCDIVQRIVNCKELQQSKIYFIPRGLLGIIVPYRMRKRPVENAPTEEIEPPRSDLEVLKRKVDILNSFFLRDIEGIAHRARSTATDLQTPIQSYFNGMLNDSKNRVDVVSDPPQNLSNQLLGRWPSDTSIELGQAQAFVLKQYVKSEVCLHAVNGPPGTGKSFIVRDLISHIIVEKAFALAQFERPELALRESLSEASISGANVRYRSLQDSILGFEILIASSNNAAVNNISKELPLTRSLGEEFQDATYLTPMAHNYFHEKERDNKESIESISQIKMQYWGFPSIALGKKGNRTHFVNKFFYPPKDENEENKSIRLDQQLLSFTEWRKLAAEGTASYRLARKNFLEAHKEVSACGDSLSSKELNKKRSELFLLALQLQEAWLRETPRLEIECNALSRFLRNPLATDECYARDLWRLLFMFIPVASTTLASVERQFLPELSSLFGNVVIDEAGQASPQSVLGLLNRAKKALILGDQRQLEPICPLPDPLVNMLANELEGSIYSRVSPSRVSVQSIADNQSKFGTYLESSSFPSWIGTPLTEHRRCEEPMFSLSNDIAYNGIMKFATPPSEFKFPLGESGWFQIEGIAAGKQWVPEQGKLLTSILNYVLVQSELLPDIFFISPFREVVRHMKDQVRGVIKTSQFAEVKGKAFTRRIGTIHTFQGREADVVFLVLGGDHGTIGACEWAGAKPNLVNVAITRARKRLYVIGDRNVWHNKGYFSDLQKGLATKNFQA